MKEQPLVSVLMTSYNREKYIAEAIESVLASSYNNFELIIVDDGSTDSTVSIARSFEQKDARISVYVNDKNLGDYNNRNKAASYAKGKYIKYLDSDDLIMPWGLWVMVYCMEKFPDASFGLIVYEYNYNFPQILSSEDAYRSFFFKGKLFNQGPGGAIMKTKDFNLLGKFSGKQYVGDTELWLKMAKYSNVVILPPELTYWRVHEEQQIVEESKNISIEAVRFNVNKDMLMSPDCPLNSNEVKIALRNIKNVKCRIIITKFLRGKFSMAYQQMKDFNLTFFDFIKAIKKNRLPINLNNQKS